MFRRIQVIANGGGTDRFSRVDPLSYTLVQSGDWEL
jgi:hypothetical protein